MNDGRRWLGCLFAVTFGAANGCGGWGYLGSNAPPDDQWGSTEGLSSGGEQNLLESVDVSVYSGQITDLEMDCLWEEGIRQVIVGTQDRRIARQQLEMAATRGMLIDAYVYLYWNEDIDQQVDDALSIVQGYPINRLWLDAEEVEDTAPPEPDAMVAILQQALARCGTTSCGIYTGAWWWVPFTQNSDAFTSVPLWYANWDGIRDLEEWGTRVSFGGWDAPLGKQYEASTWVCGIWVDRNVMNVTDAPWATAPRPAESTEISAAPSSGPENLYPDHLSVAASIDGLPPYLRFMAGQVAQATQYEFAIEDYRAHSDGTTAYQSYWWATLSQNGWTPWIAPDKSYRFRVRGQNDFGAGPWSEWAYFHYGEVDEATGPVWPVLHRPGPTVLSPEPESQLVDLRVALSASRSLGALRYEFLVLTEDDSTTVAQVSATDAETWFYPFLGDEAYRVRVRALLDSGYTDWSEDVLFSCSNWWWW